MRTIAAEPIALRRSLPRGRRSPPFALSWMALLALTAVSAQAQQSDLEPTWIQPPGIVDLPPLSNRPPIPDTLTFRVGQSFQDDSNIFRRPDDLAVSDRYGITTLGLKFDKRFSLQQLELDVNLQDYRYRSNSSLDFTALNYAAAWRWSLTPRLFGNATLDQREFVDNTADVTASGEVNRRTEKATLVDAEYEVGAAWRVLGGVFERSLKNSVPFSAESGVEADSRVTGAEAGARYVFRSGNSLAYRYKSGDGEYTGRPATLLAPSDFTDRTHEVSLEWQPGGSTTVQGRVGHLDRSHDGFAARDFSGVIGLVNVNWALTGKTRLEVGVVRDLVSYQTSTTSYYESDRLYISPVWKPTEKTAVRLRLDQGVRRYKGELPGEVSSGRRDTVTLTGLALEWEPLRQLLLVASLQHDKRDSNLNGLDYKANVVGVSALLRF